jgi:tricorn protease
VYDVRSPSLSEGRIAYQLGADLHVYDIAANRDQALSITLVSDFDQLRERWIKEPLEWITAAHLSPTGDRVAMTARGQLFVMPADQGRIVETTRNKTVRYREARFFADGKSLLALSDESGEVEFWKLPANGVGKGVQLTTDASVLRWDGVPSPDGKFIAHFDKDQQLWVYDVEKSAQKRLAVSADGDFGDVHWSPTANGWRIRPRAQPAHVCGYGVGSASARRSPRTDVTVTARPGVLMGSGCIFVRSSFRLDRSQPVGSREPEPFFDKSTQVFHVSLSPGERLAVPA